MIVMVSVIMVWVMVRGSGGGGGLHLGVSGEDLLRPHANYGGLATMKYSLWFIESVNDTESIGRSGHFIHLVGRWR